MGKSKGKYTTFATTHELAEKIRWMKKNSGQPETKLMETIVDPIFQVACEFNHFNIETEISILQNSITFRIVGSSHFIVGETEKEKLQAKARLMDMAKRDIAKVVKRNEIAQRTKEKLKE